MAGTHPAFASEAPEREPLPRLETPIRLVSPGWDYLEAYRWMLRQYDQAAEASRGRGVELAREDFGRYLAFLDRGGRGRRARAGRPGMSVFWLVDAGGQVLGSARLRHWLTERTYRIGGHIGYDIRPDLRGRGLGTLQLRLVLEQAAWRGMARVLLTVEESNTASMRVLAKCGAREDRAILRRGVRHRRYWIWLR